MVFFFFFFKFFNSIILLDFISKFIMLRKIKRLLLILEILQNPLVYFKKE